MWIIFSKSKYTKQPTFHQMAINLSSLTLDDKRIVFVDISGGRQELNFDDSVMCAMVYDNLIDNIRRGKTMIELELEKYGKF